MKVTILAALAAVLAASYAHADTCGIDGTSRTCEVVCNETQPGGATPCVSSMPTHAQCDQDNDGWCTICGQAGSHDYDPNTPSILNRSNRIQGTDGPDWICGKNGEDEIDGNEGDDVIDAGGDNDDVDGGDGDDVIYGNSDDDDLDGQAGNDWIDGGNGDDTIHDDEGGNILIGGSGTDTITVTGTGATHDALGNVLCGGTGPDTLSASSEAHVCFEGGTNSGGSDSCTYTRPGSPDSQDVATQLDCETTSGPFEADTRSCGCP